VTSSRFILGIPRCNETEDIFSEAVAAARGNTLSPTAALIIDNGDTPLGAISGFEIRRPPKNTGCAGAWNMICHAAFNEFHSDSAVLVNADCTVLRDTFASLFAAPCGFVCAHAFGCFRIDREVWLRVGPFDEEFYPAYWEDTDYRRRLRLAGIVFDEWPVEEVEVIYPGRARYRSGIVHGKNAAEPYQGWTGEKSTWFQQRLVINEQRYVDKWGGVPGTERFQVPFDGKRFTDA
jgi:hypothetical protein